MTPPAVTAARRGWYVIPIVPGEKRPAIPGHKEQNCPRAGYCRDGHKTWEELACADPDRVASAWSGRWRGHNAGIACGPSGLAVLDLDRHTELPAEWQAEGCRDGIGVFEWLCSQAGENWPVTFEVATASGGRHVYFRQPADPVRNTQGGRDFGPGIDVRGRGGQVLCPGSVIGGRRYEVVRDMPAEVIPEWPGWLSRLRSLPGSPRQARRVTAGGGGSRDLDSVIARYLAEQSPGNRNPTLYSAALRAGNLVTLGLVSEAEAVEALTSAAMSAGIRGGEREARATAQSGVSTGIRKQAERRAVR